MSLATTAAEYDHELLNENDGISSSIIFSMVQDEDGFLWLGTGYNGVLRYDGKNVVTYLHDSEDKTSLPHNNAGNLYFDKQNRLWIGSWGGGLLKFDTNTETFSQLNYVPNDERSVGNNRVQSLHEDRKGRLWVGTYTAGINLYHESTQDFTRFPQLDAETNGTSDLRIWDIEETEEDTLWIATDFGLNKFDIQSNKFRHFYPESESMLSEHNRIRRLVLGKQNTMFIGTQNGVFRFNLETEQFSAIPVENLVDLGPVYSMIKTSFNEYWLTTDYGVYSFSENAKQIKKVPLDFDDRCSQTLFEDRQGTIWLSCEGVGLYKITRKSIFSTINDPSLNSAFVLRRANDDSVLIGTSQGELKHWDPANETLTTVSNSRSLPSISAIRYIAQSNAGDIWFTSEQALYKIDKNGQQTELLPPSHLQDWFFEIRDIETDESNNLWIATTNGLFFIDHESNNFEFHSISEISNDKLTDSVSSRLYLDYENRMWLTFGNSLFLADNQRESFKELVDQNIVFDAFGETNLIYALYLDSQKQLWIGNKLGLFKVDTKTGKRALVSDFFDERDNQGVRFIDEDENGFIWLVTAIGVSRFDPKTGEMRHFDKRDGLPGSRYFYNPTSTNSDKQIYISSRDGVFYFDPLAIKDYEADEDTKLTNFEVLGSSLGFNINEVSELGARLDYDQSNIKFEFATLDLLNARQIQYSYMLEGFDESWIENGSNTSATYTNLNGGEYVFRVKSRIKQNLWYDKELAVNVTVATPIWERGWMFGVYAGVLILGILIYIQRQKQAVIELERQVAEKTADIANESSKLAAANRIKTQFLANMSHEIRTPLTTVIGQAEAIICRDVEPKDIYKEVEIIHDSSLYLLALLNDILDLTKIEENKFELEYSPQDLHILLSNINTMFSMQAKVKGLSFSLHENLPQPFVVHIDGLRLKQILINLLSNALKFTLQGSVELKVVLDKNQLTFHISDTGIGISDEQVQQIFDSFTQGDSSIRRRFGGSGLGLHLSNQLAHLMGGHITVSSELDKGSQFTFSMPIPITSGNKELPQGTLDFDTLSAKPLFNGKILLAEDHEDNRRLISRLLSKLGLTVYAAKDGYEATELYKEHQPEVVLMDIQMPRMDGIQAYNELRKLGCEKPIIALTANAMQNEVEAYFELGFDGYIQKPIDRHLLISTIATFFGSKDDDSMNRASSVLGNVDMSDLVAQFTTGLQNELVEFETSAKDENIEAIRNRAHRLSGAAQLFGFDSLSTMATQLEKNIKAGGKNMHAIQDDYSALINEIKNNIA
jgi:signal transduction histidine kinase/FixJ family two-component response regulator/streptogramin lyase